MNAYFKPLCYFVLAILSSTAHAVTLLPANSPFTARGVISLQSGFYQMTCNLELTGTTNSQNTASIYTLSITGPGFCPTASASMLPWTWTATSTTAVSLSGVKLSVLGQSCTISSATLYGTWSNATNSLSIMGSPFLGNCIINSLSLSPLPTFVVLP